MTVHIPKWLLLTALGAVVVGGIGVGAYMLGKSSDDDDEPTGAQRLAVPLEGEPSEEAGPGCSKPAAKDAVLDSEFEASVRELGAVQPADPLFGGFGYVVAEVICRDLTGDGAEEMVAQLGCCTGGSPSPWAIFVDEDGAWQPAFYRTGIQASLSVEGDAIVEKSPAYAAGEPTCCPSTFRFGRVSWDGSEFAFESDEASTNRTIKAGTQGVTRLGTFQPQSDSPVEAAEEFGPPSYVGPKDELCVNEWRDLGLLINFANLGGADPCSADGRVGSIELKDEFAAQAGWETDQGVRVEMSLDQLREIYPDAQTQSLPGLGKVLVLVEGPTIIGGGGTYPVLSARIADGAVDELRMSVGAAGE
jgi:hypothetical protein